MGDIGMNSTITTLNKLVDNLCQQNTILQKVKSCSSDKHSDSIQQQINDNVTRITKLQATIEFYENNAETACNDW